MKNFLLLAALLILSTGCSTVHQVLMTVPAYAALNGQPEAYNEMMRNQAIVDAAKESKKIDCYGTSSTFGYTTSTNIHCQ